MPKDLNEPATGVSLSEAQGVLFANMVADQQQQAIEGEAAALKAAEELMGLEDAPSPAEEARDALREEAVQERSKDS